MTIEEIKYENKKILQQKFLDINRNVITLMSPRTQNTALFLALVVGTNDINQLEIWISELIENQNDYENMEEGNIYKKQSNIKIEDIYLKNSIAEIIESPRKDLPGIQGWGKSLSDILNISDNSDNNSEFSVRTPGSANRNTLTYIDRGNKERQGSIKVIGNPNDIKAKRKPPPIPRNLPVVSININNISGEVDDIIHYTTMESIVKPSLNITNESKHDSLQRIAKRSKSLLSHSDKSQHLTSPEVIRKSEIANVATISVVNTNNKEIRNKTAKHSSIRSINSRASLITNDYKRNPSPEKLDPNINSNLNDNALRMKIEDPFKFRSTLYSDYKNIAPLPTATSLSKVSNTTGSRGFVPKPLELITQAPKKLRSELAVDTNNINDSSKSLKTVKSISDINSPPRFKTNKPLIQYNDQIISSRLRTEPTADVLELKVINPSKLDEILKAKTTRTKPIIGTKLSNKSEVTVSSLKLGERSKSNLRR